MSSNFTPWERVQISRSAERPTSLDYISTILNDICPYTETVILEMTKQSLVV